MEGVPVEIQLSEEARRFHVHARCRCMDTRAAPLREMTGQSDVLDHRQIWNQVEHLKNIADMVGAKAITRSARLCTGVMAQQLDRSLLRRDHTGDQAQQRGLSAAARTAEKQPFAARDTQRIHVQDGGSFARPRKTNRRELDDGLGGYGHVNRLKHLAAPVRSAAVSHRLKVAARGAGEYDRPARIPDRYFPRQRSGTDRSCFAQRLSFGSNTCGTKKSFGSTSSRNSGHWLCGNPMLVAVSRQLIL